MKTVNIVANAVRARLLDADREAKLLVSAFLSYAVAGAERSDAYQTGGWDGKRSLFEFGKGLFPAGFVHPVEQHLREKGYKVIVRRKKRPPPLGPELIEAYKSVQPFGVNPIYDYQPETVRRLVKHGSMVARIATGGGKSIVARTAVAHIRRPTLFLTTRKVLMYQMKTGFEEANFRVGVMGDGDWNPLRGVNVGMVQTLHARLNSEKHCERTSKILNLIELAILEEAHEAGSEGYFEVMNAMENAHYRLALTGTPFMRTDEEANMRLMAVAGQVGINISEKMLIDRGVLSTPVFRYRDDIPVPKKLRMHSGWQRAYDLGIINNEGRNQAIVQEVARARDFGLTSMVLIQRKAHGELLKKMMREAGLRADFIFGEHDQDRRDRALKRLATGQLDCLLGSTILDVGVDVPSLGLIVLGGGGKAEIALRQRIGRALRKKKTGPNISLVLDFEDSGNKYLRDHAKQRRGIVAATPGFAENILPEGMDFPYHLFRAAAA